MPDHHLSVWQWAMAVGAGFCIGLSKTGFGGLGMLTVVLMAQVLPPRESTGVVLPLLIFADFFAVGAFRRHAQWHHLWGLVLPAALGVVAGFFLMPRVPDRWFGPAIGAIVLAMVAVQYLRRFRPQTTAHLPASRAFAWTMGGFAGVTTMLANAAGPVMTLYLLARRLPKYEFVGTAAVFFLAINLFKVPFSWWLGLINGSSLWLNLILAPAVAAGALLGRRLIHHIPQKLFEELLLAFAALASLRLLLGG